MVVVRNQRSTVDAADPGEPIARRGLLIAAVATLATVPNFPEARTAMSLTPGAVIHNGEVTDAR